MDLQDTQQLLDVVSSFAGERIAGCCPQPEDPMDTDQLQALAVEAGELGLLPYSSVEEGISIWEHTEDANAMAFNLGTLKHLAQANTGLAFAWHRQALAREVLAKLGVEMDSDALRLVHLTPTGHFGLARTSLAKWLLNESLTDEDESLLADWLERSTNETLVYAPKNWQTLVYPVWQDGQIAWQVAERSKLSVKSDRPQHGFDELGGFEVTAKITADATKVHMLGDNPEASAQFYADILKMEFLGLMAIGLGTLKRGQLIAHEFASIRKQGGKYIAAHPAVQQLLSDVDIAVNQSEMTLRALTHTLADLKLNEIAACRANISPLLCHAANQVVQVHGGVGYMRDAWPEKMVRDLNMLRMLSGGMRDIQLFLAGFKGGLAC